MGLQIIMSFHQRENIVFDDIKALNEDLMANTSFGELFGEVEQIVPFEGPFKFEEDELKIASNWDGYLEEYGLNTMVWGCYGDDVFQTIAKHLTGGKIVFFVDIEGNDNEFHIITPGNAEKRLESSITF